MTESWVWLEATRSDALADPGREPCGSTVFAWRNSADSVAESGIPSFNLLLRVGGLLPVVSSFCSRHSSAVASIRTSIGVRTTTGNALLGIDH